ncbi:MAG: Pantothenate kinase type III, CoaX-like, partial [uncultured Thermomicrobiales bacterium]
VACDRCGEHEHGLRALRGRESSATARWSGCLGPDGGGGGRTGRVVAGVDPAGPDAGRVVLVPLAARRGGGVPARGHLGGGARQRRPERHDLDDRDGAPPPGRRADGGRGRARTRTGALRSNRPAGGGRRRSPGQRRRGLRPVRRPVDRRRLRHGDDLRRHRAQRRLPRRRHRAGDDDLAGRPCRPRGAVVHGRAGAARAGDRDQHRGQHAVGRRAGLPGDGRGHGHPDSCGARRRRPRGRDRWLRRRLRRGVSPDRAPRPRPDDRRPAPYPCPRRGRRSRGHHIRRQL